MPASTSAGSIVGRRDALDSVAEFLRGIDAGPAALILEGEPGIGKTTLWQAAIELAASRGHGVLSTRPAQSEAKLSYIGLVDLLEGAIDDVLDQLPGPQRRALEVALLRVEASDEPVDPGTLLVGALNSVRALAASSPVVIAVDDVQWLDPATANTLAFIARRLGREHVGFLVAARGRIASTVPVQLLDGLERQRVSTIELAGLHEGDLRRILRDRFGNDLSKEALDRAAGVSAGNPFWAIEVARGVLVGRLRLEGGALMLPSDLAALVPNHIGELTESTQELLLLCSAVSAPTAALLRSVSAAPERVSSQLAEAEAAGIVQVDSDRVRFTHPLLSSTVYSQAPPEGRREVHRRLATVLADAEERARHLGLAADGPDPEIAVALENGARVARVRGSPEAAGRLLELAIGLTPPDFVEDVTSRRIDAADCFTLTGDFDRARRHLESVLSSAPEGPERADALWRLARVRFLAGHVGDAARLLTEALKQHGAPHRLKSLIHQWRAWVASAEVRLDEAEREAEAAVAEAETSEDVTCLHESLVALALMRFRLGYGTQWTLLERAEDLESSMESFMVIDRSRYWVAGYLFIEGRLDEARTIYLSFLEEAAARGDEVSVQELLTFLGALGFRSGDWPQALEYLAEALAIAPGRALTLGCRALVEACTGDLEASGADAKSVLDRVADVGVRGFAEIDAHHALGLSELSAGNIAAAVSHLQHAWGLTRDTGENDPDTFPFVADLVEALVDLGRLDEAESRLEWLEERGRTLERALALATGSRCRGLVEAANGDLSAALVSLDDALEHHERLPMPFELARTLLVQGRIRRRARQKRPAREALEHALAIFEELGAPLWADRARAELARVSGRRPARSELTEVERRVARLAAAGRTNKEIADSLFMSPRTVGGHLSSVYGKLHVRSRTELAGVPDLVQGEPLHS